MNPLRKAPVNLTGVKKSRFCSIGNVPTTAAKVKAVNHDDPADIRLITPKKLETILAGPVPKKRDSCVDDLSHLFYQLLRVVLSSLCVLFMIWSPSGTDVSSYLRVDERSITTLLLYDVWIMTGPRDTYQDYQVLHDERHQVLHNERHLKSSTRRGIFSRWNSAFQPETPQHYLQDSYSSPLQEEASFLVGTQPYNLSLRITTPSSPRHEASSPPLLIYAQTRRHPFRFTKSSTLETTQNATLLEATVLKLRLSSPLTTEATLYTSEAVKPSATNRLKIPTLEDTASELGLLRKITSEAVKPSATNRLKIPTLEDTASELGLLRKMSTTSLPTSTDHRRRLKTTLHNTSDISTVTTQDLDQLKEAAPITSDEVNLNHSKTRDEDPPHYTLDYSTNYLLDLEEFQDSATEYFYQKEEKTTANSFLNALSTTRELGEQLLCSTAIQPNLANCYNKLPANLHNLTNDWVSDLCNTQSLFVSIRSRRHKGLASSWEELRTQTARISLTQDSHDAYSTTNTTSSSSPPIYYSILGNNYHLDYQFTSTMPNNSGEKYDWTTYSDSCQSINEDEKELNLIQKLHCPRKSTSHPRILLLLQLPAATSEFCLEFLTDLQDKIILSRLVHSLRKTISSLTTTNYCKFDNLLLILVDSRYQQKSCDCSNSALLPRLQKKRYACTTSAMALLSRQQKNTSALPLLFRQNTDSTMPLPFRQKSHDGSTPTPNFDYFVVKLKKYLIYLCSQKQNYKIRQARRSISSGNRCHDPEEDLPPDSTTLLLYQPQQLPEALLMAGEMLLQAQENQQDKTKTCSTQDAALSPSPAGSLIDRQQQQTILSEESDCQHSGENYSQADLPPLALCQKKRNDNLSCEEVPLSPSATLTISAGLDSSSSEAAPPTCGATLHLDHITAKENSTPAAFATKISAFNSCPTLLTIDPPALCVNTEIAPETILPPTVSTNELQNPATARHPPQKELLELNSTTTSRQPPQKELLDLTNSTICKQLPQKELLEHSRPVEFSTSISPKTDDQGNTSLTRIYFSSYTDWCWAFSSNLIYQDVSLQPATHSVPLVTFDQQHLADSSTTSSTTSSTEAATYSVSLMTPNHQNPADSSTTSSTETENKTAELCRLRQDKFYLIRSTRLSINIKRKLSSTSSRLEPCTQILIYNQTFLAGSLPAYHRDSAWIMRYLLTLSPCGFTILYTTDLNLMLLSDRCLSTIAYSSYSWKIQHHLQNLQTAKDSISFSHQRASTICCSSDPKVHPQFLQCPSTEMPPETCCSWPDCKPNSDSTPEAFILYYNPEEASSGRWRPVSTKVILAHRSSRSKLLLYVSLTLFDLYLAVFDGLHPFSPCSLLSLHLLPLAAYKDCTQIYLAACKDCTQMYLAACKDCTQLYLAACKDCTQIYHSHLHPPRFYLSADYCYSGLYPDYFDKNLTLPQAAAQQSTELLKLMSLPRGQDARSSCSPKSTKDTTVSSIYDHHQPLQPDSLLVLLCLLSTLLLKRLDPLPPTSTFKRPVTKLALLHREEQLMAPPGALPPGACLDTKD